jgi:hypothetical protein
MTSSGPGNFDKFIGYWLPGVIAGFGLGFLAAHLLHF